MEKKLYFLSASDRYNHGCTDSAVYRDNGDCTATCIEVNNCHSCWQVGHDRNHEYAVMGDTVILEWLEKHPDIDDNITE